MYSCKNVFEICLHEYILKPIPQIILGWTST